MDPSEAVAQAIALLAPVTAAGVKIAQGAAARALGDLAAARLRQEGHEGAWQRFRKDPGNDSLVRYLLQGAIASDAVFRRQFGAALNAASAERAARAGHQSITFTGTGDAHIGDHSDRISGGRVATRGGSYYEDSNVVNEGDKITHKRSNVGLIAFLAVAAAVIVVALVVKGVSGLAKKTHDAGLSATSTCQQFLDTDEQSEQQALVDIAISKGISGFGSPLALPEIRYECSGTPSMTIGAVIERDKGEF